MAEYIEREKLYQFLTEQLDKETGAYSKGRNAGIHVARSALHNREITPAANVELVVHGRFKVKRGNFITGGGNPLWCCSNCSQIFGASLIPPKDNYCPSCGAKMDGGAIDGVD